MKIIIASICLILANCLSDKSTRFTNPNSDSTVKITIAATNDVHGAVLSETKTFNGIKYDVGGFQILETMLNSLKKDNPNFIYLDAGDQFQGTPENEDTEGSIVYEGFHELGLSATTIGNHEWDWKKERLNKILASAKYKYICANLNPLSDENYKKKIVEYQRDGRNLDKINKIREEKFDHEKLSKSEIFNVGPIKLGVIGLTTKETWISTTYPPYGYEITDYVDAIKEQVAVLKGKNADSIVVISHVGIKCSQDNDELLKYRNYTSHNAQKHTDCEMKELGELFKSGGGGGDKLLENGKPIIDAWIAGHIHEPAHMFYNGIPVVQNPIGGLYFNALHLSFKKTGNKYEILRDQTIIEGSIPICSHVFKNGKCEIEGEGPLEQFEFHGQKVTRGDKITALFQNYEKIKVKYKGKETDELCWSRWTAMKSEILAHSNQDILNSKSSENMFGVLFGQLLLDHYNTVTPKPKHPIIYINGYGSFRTDWKKGDISAYHLKKLFPFLERHVEVNITGENLYKLIKKLQEGKKALYITHGLKYDMKDQDGKWTLLSKLEEVKYVSKDLSNKVIETSLKADNVYTIIINDFQFNGGDDFIGLKNLVIDEIPKELLINKTNLYIEYFKFLMKETYINKNKSIDFKDYVNRITVKKESNSNSSSSKFRLRLTKMK